MGDARYDSYMGNGPKRMAHWEHWSCPDAETHITGIDYYEHPKRCRQKMADMYRFLNLRIPEKDEPIPRPRLDGQTHSSALDDQGRLRVRWGANTTSHWAWGHRFKSIDDVLTYSPLAHADMREMEVVEKHDYTSEETLFQEFRKGQPEEWGDQAPEGSSASVSFYNTMFMWPLLTFGWEKFLEVCLLPEFERIMDEFAEINRRVFRAFARLPVNFVVCHDDIVNARGPVCSARWMHKYIFPRYEEFWGIVKDAGKEVLFMSDGRMDAFVDDVMACGARGVISEPFTDYKAIARRYHNPFIAGEGDNRILMRNNPEEIRAMVSTMAETGRMSGGYMMCVGNHIPWNIPPQAVKLYLDLSEELAYR